MPSTGTPASKISGGGNGVIYFRDGKVVYAESERTPGPAHNAYSAYAEALPPLSRIVAIRAVTEPIIDAVLELFTAQARHAKFRSSRLPVTGLASGIDVETLLAEIDLAVDVVSEAVVALRG